ncbi:MAG: hypothetical protein A2122_01255 [Candidatus Liptonbacteria bacterium GWB1_49_6]|uniref:Penicillin-binding protein 2 n=1 Tax=Candidatus Liptonbacteria bacterium GWB1_49_6 TaxID=1798644 RepID=A0A1G2C793_9BACT|nr:MAG: hypothetical protein A2122_01255 [Candidatus Liptonbacteria bacterium GWB1_49_6]
MFSHRDVAVEEVLSDSLVGEYGVREVPLANRSVLFVGVGIFVLCMVAIGRVVIIANGFASYAESASRNLTDRRTLEPPRGLIYDRNGTALAENVPSFLLFLDVRGFVEHRELEDAVLTAIESVTELTAADVRDRIREAEYGKRAGKILLSDDITESQLIAIQSSNLAPLSVEKGFRRRYSYGPVFSSVLGYVGAVNADDLKEDPSLDVQAIIGKSGIEAFYDGILRGEPGELSQFRNAKGEPMGETKEKAPVIGKTLKLTIDAEFQEYFFKRFEDGLRALGRTKGVGLAMDPRNGEVLALFNFPAFDGNAFVESSRSAERKTYLNSTDRPLFNRAVGGFYNPGSTIKPLVGTAALVEDVVDPARQIFSPGYLDVPNPYDPSNPTRYLDWRRQGWVNLSSALAQSSNVYFYTVGGGFGDIGGLGISRLYTWWQKFGLGKQTGIDMPFEAKGFLPTPELRKEKDGRSWLLGDTYNVSIGQGDLLVTPLQLLNYISALGNGGKMFLPFLNGERSPEETADLSAFLPYLNEVKKGMVGAVEFPLGTAHLLSSLPFPVAAKTGSAQVQNNTQENAFFVGYAPASEQPPQIAILVLIENSREGSLNVVPIAKDAINWYYMNRIKR